MLCPAPFQASLPETKVFEHRQETFADVCPQNGACSRGFILELGPLRLRHSCLLSISFPQARVGSASLRQSDHKGREAQENEHSQNQQYEQFWHA
jgi:hypothetical protein